MILAVLEWLWGVVLSIVFDALVVFSASYLGGELMRFDLRLIEAAAFPAALLVLLLTVWSCGRRRGAAAIWYLVLLVCANLTVVAGSVLLYDGVSLDPRLWSLSGGVIPRPDIVAFVSFTISLVVTILMVAAGRRQSGLSSKAARVQSIRSRRSGGRSISYPGGGEESPGSIGQDAG